MSKKQYIKQFEDFLTRQEFENNESLAIDDEKDKQKWVAEIDDFYEIIQGFIHEYLKQGKIRQEWQKIQLQEDFFGEYEVKQLMLKIGKKRLIFKPIGRFVVGCRGRIDLFSDLGSIRFLLVPQHFDKPQDYFLGELLNPNIKWTWKIATPPPSTQYLEITGENFFNALMEIVDG
ncbi:MAG: hypothetical protein VKJ02_16015 [Snowella sp.]|nr:hypothetical protein [Snowella sp.]